MIPYNQFQLNESQIKHIQEDIATKKISEYIKRHGAAPVDTASFYIVDTATYENYRRIYYSLYCAKGQDVPVTPIEPYNPPYNPSIDDSGSTFESGSTIKSGNTEESGSTIDSGNTQPSDDSFATVMFDITMNPIEYGLSSDTDIANGIFKPLILNGTLLDKSIVNLSLKGNGTSISIDSLDKMYNIPRGHYTIKGNVGEMTDNEGSYEKTCVKIDTEIDIENEGLYKLQSTMRDAIIASNEPFSYHYSYYFSYTTYTYSGETFTIPGYNYIFTHKRYHARDISNRNFGFESISYDNNSILDGKFYYYNTPAMPQQSGNTQEEQNESQLKYDDFVRMTYNITTKAEPTQLFSTSASTNGIGYMEIDGVEIEPVSAYTFNSLGTHKVDVLLKDPTTMLPLQFENINTLKEIVIPECVYTLGSEGLFYNCKSIVKITSLPLQAPSYYKSRTANGKMRPDFKEINSNGELWVRNGSKGYTGTYEWMGGFQDGYALGNYNWTLKYIEDE